MTEPIRQTTVEHETDASGITLHGGVTVRMRLTPAPPNSGVVFIRTDLPGAPEIAVAQTDADPAALQRRTELADPASGARVATTEHLLAACLGMGLDNVRVELDGAEVPIFDGSVLPFVKLIDRAGIRRQKAPRAQWTLRRPVALMDKGREILAVPANRMQLTFFATLAHAGIPNQAAELQLGGSVAEFRAQAAARTWVFFEELERLRAAGLIRGGSLDNAIVLRDGRPIREDGTEAGDYRLPNELACHKLLDLLGDLALLGRPVGALITARGAGHAMNQAFVRLLRKELE